MSAGLAASDFLLRPRKKKKNGFAASRILWPGRALDSVLPPGFRPLPSFHLRHACLDSHAKHFLDGCFLDTRGTPPTVSWKRFESGFCSRSRVDEAPLCFRTFDFRRYHYGGFSNIWIFTLTIFLMQVRWVAEPKKTAILIAVWGSTQPFSIPFLFSLRDFLPAR